VRSHEEAETARREVLAKARAIHPSPVSHAVTIDDLLPGPPDETRRKLDLITEIRRLQSPANLALLSDEERHRLDDVLPPDDLRPHGLEEIPALLRRPFTERDGTIGRVVLIYAPSLEQGFSLTDGHDLIRLARAIREVPMPDGRVLHATGRPVIFAAMLESIARDGPVATAVSFVAVALLTFALLARARVGGARRRGAGAALVILGALSIGVLWMLGVAAALDVKLNAFNFVALPITFGIGVDYAANVFLRYRDESLAGGGRAARVLSSTGGAVVLNSLTTMLGYGALLLAHSGALRSFGSLAVLGELGCLSAAMLLMPAAMDCLGRQLGTLR
jgi:hypothetical protein